MAIKTSLLVKKKTITKFVFHKFALKQTVCYNIRVHAQSLVVKQVPMM